MSNLSFVLFNESEVELLEFNSQWFDNSSSEGTGACGYIASWSKTSINKSNRSSKKTASAAARSPVTSFYSVPDITVPRLIEEQVHEYKYSLFMNGAALSCKFKLFVEPGPPHVWSLNAAPEMHSKGIMMCDLTNNVSNSISVTLRDEYGNDVDLPPGLVPELFMSFNEPAAPITTGGGHELETPAAEEEEEAMDIADAENQTIANQNGERFQLELLLSADDDDSNIAYVLRPGQMLVPNAQLTQAAFQSKFVWLQVVTHSAPASMHTNIRTNVQKFVIIV